jgi:hypothetical protein
MKMPQVLAALIAVFSLASVAVAGGPGELVQAPGYGDYGVGYCDVCDPCCGHHGHCGHHCQWRLWYQQNAVFNCGCNGSYKHPVPPLYTYHWPGMYSAQRMTDYVSPWRFPPLKPYTDEPVIEVQSTGVSLRRVRTASAVVETSAPAQASSFSDHVERSLR